MAERKRGIKTWGMALAVATLVHGVILIPFLLQRSKTLHEPPPVQLILQRPSPQVPKLKPPASATAAAPSGASTTAPAALASAAPTIADAPPSSSIQGPAGGAAAPSGSGLGQSGQGPALNLACLGDLKRLRTDERRKCEGQQFAQAGVRDPHDNGQAMTPSMAPEKAAHYEAVLAAKHSAGHPPGFGCVKKITLGEGGTKLTKKLKKQRLAEQPDRPPNSLKLGPLPCFITPPQGFLTPEADVPPIEDFKGHTPERSTAYDGRPRFSTGPGGLPSAASPGAGTTQPAN